jgi:hypothetical protein
MRVAVGIALIASSAFLVTAPPRGRPRYLYLCPGRDHALPVECAAETQAERTGMRFKEMRPPDLVSYRIERPFNRVIARHRAEANARNRTRPLLLP